MLRFGSTLTIHYHSSEENPAMQATKTKKHISRRLRRFARGNEVVSALEYAILVGVIAVAIATALAAFGTNITAALTNIGTQIAAPDTDDLDI